MYFLLEKSVVLPLPIVSFLEWDSLIHLGQIGRRFHQPGSWNPEIFRWSQVRSFDVTCSFMGWCMWGITMLQLQWRFFFGIPSSPKKREAGSWWPRRFFLQTFFDRSACMYYMSCINKYIHININIIYIYISLLYMHTITLPFEGNQLEWFVSLTPEPNPHPFCWPAHSIAPNARAGLGFGKPPWKCPEKKKTRTPKQIDPEKSRVENEKPKDPWKVEMLGTPSRLNGFFVAYFSAALPGFFVFGSVIP